MLVRIPFCLTIQSGLLSILASFNFLHARLPYQEREEKMEEAEKEVQSRISLNSNVYKGKKIIPTLVFSDVFEGGS